MTKRIWFLRVFIASVVVLAGLCATAKADSIATRGVSTTPVVYLFHLADEIGPATWRITQQSFNRAEQLGAKAVVIHMNTYGGLVDAADSIRTKIINSPIPVYVFVDNNAISAGALIAIAADKIYMREGASIGAATVVNQSAEAMPDKYQSFMRSMMRATAESHGKDTIIEGADTVYRWFRDPHIAEAMVDPRVSIAGLIDSTKVLTLTADEAISVHYCEGKVSSVEEVLVANDLSNCQIEEHRLTALDKLIHFLMSPYLQSILIMLIIGGLYFELQTPGIGFPLVVSISAALLYFAPLYLEGIANHWEIALFVLGLILIGIEIFAIPGFGVAGISGIILMVLGISLAMIDNLLFEWDLSFALQALFKSVTIVIVSSALALGLSIWAGKYFLRNTLLSRVTLQTEQSSADGYIGVENLSGLIGATGTVRSMLRPSGKISIDGKLYDALSEIGYINTGEAVRVIRYETGQLHVVKQESAHV